MWWWFPCPGGPIHAIHADMDHIHTHTYTYIHIPPHTPYTCTYMYIPTHTCAYLYIHAHTCTYLHIETPHGRMRHAKSGPGVGPGGPNKGDGHMPWDALSGAHVVRGPNKVFWGCGGDLRPRASQSRSGGVFEGLLRPSPAGCGGATIPDRL